MADQAFVTLATNDSYAKGAMVLGAGLRSHKTSRKLAVLVGNDVSQPYRSALGQIFDEVCEVNVLDSGDSAHLALMKRPELSVTFTKLHCWSLTHYTKCVFMDADTLVLCNIDDLFEREELSAAPDPGWPDCFNSGVFVFRPSKETYTKLLNACNEHGSFDGGDQGVLNSYFSDWATADIAKHLPFIYNLSSVSIYTYLPAFRQFGHNAKVIHFLGERKPWDRLYDGGEGSSRDPEQHRSSSLYPDFVQQWWSVYTSSVLPLLIEEQTTIGEQNKQSANATRVESQSVCMVEVQYEVCAPQSDPQISSQQRKQKWEQGDADYLGEDSFSHIEKKLESFLN